MLANNGPLLSVLVVALLTALIIYTHSLSSLASPSPPSSLDLATNSSLNASHPNIELTTEIDKLQLQEDGHIPARMAKISMLYGSDNEIYERALRTHQLHNQLHGYPTYILRNDIIGGYWNKPAYILSLITAELAKPAGERVQWFMWVDADSVLLNPRVPLESFLPPNDFSGVHFIATKDWNGFNSGTFFIHVHEWSIKFLQMTAAFPFYRPEVNLGGNMDQRAMALLFSEPDFKDGVIYQPMVWTNAYDVDGWRGQPGDLLVHFPGIYGDDRWKHMSKWLEIVETRPDEWEVPMQNTSYPAEIPAFWGELRLARETVAKAEEKLRIGGKEGMKQKLEPLTNLLKTAMQKESDKMTVVVSARQQVEKAMQELDAPPPPPPDPPAEQKQEQPQQNQQR